MDTPVKPAFDRKEGQRRKKLAPSPDNPKSPLARRDQFPRLVADLGEDGGLVDALGLALGGLVAAGAE